MYPYHWKHLRQQLLTCKEINHQGLMEFLQMYMWNSGTGFSRDVNIAQISLLLKKDKDPVDCNGYRPLSLLNVDLKKCKNVGLTHSESHANFVSSDQTGFIKSRLAADNVRWLLHLIDTAVDKTPPAVPMLKMNILPRINVITSMIQVFNYWNKIHSNISQFIWNKKNPHLKLPTTQKEVASGGLSVPNLRFYFRSFVLRPLLVWHDSNASFSWCKLEENILRPWNLQEVLFANISNKQCRLRFGPRVLHLVQTWCVAELQCKVSCKWHTLTPILSTLAY